MLASPNRPRPFPGGTSEFSAACSLPLSFVHPRDPPRSPTDDENDDDDEDDSEPENDGGSRDKNRKFGDLGNEPEFDTVGGSNRCLCSLQRHRERRGRGRGRWGIQHRHTITSSVGLLQLLFPDSPPSCASAYLASIRSRNRSRRSGSARSQRHARCPSGRISQTMPGRAW
jgi:hypothetical protein